MVCELRMRFGAHSCTATEKRMAHPHARETILAETHSVCASSSLAEASKSSPSNFRRCVFRGASAIRRVFSLTIFLGVLLLIKTAVGAQEIAPEKKTAPQVRMKWQDFIAGPDGAQRLASLKGGVAKMKSLDNSPPDSVDFRRSWKYWANIHGYYGPQSPDGTVAQQIQYL